MPEGIKELRGATVVVTGAASGIGLATAKALAKAGAKLHLCDVNEERLAEAASSIGSAVVSKHRVDVSKREEVRVFADAVHESSGGVDLLINNAGVGLAGGILNTSLEDWEWVLSINLWGVIHGCHYFVPKMVERKRGHVVNVASALGLFAAPDTMGYSTSKFAVVGLSEAMREELRPHGIGVTTICPGVIDTNIVHTTRYRQNDPEKTRARIIAMYKKRGYGADRVAQTIVNAVKNGRGVVPVSPEAWLAYYVKRFVPGLAAPIGRAMQKQALGRSDA